MIAAPYRRLSFDLPPELEASEPPEARGITRDAVRLLVAKPDSLTDSTFGELPRFLQPGDLVVINTSGTIPAAVDALGDDGTPVVLHLSSDLGDGTWVVEPRRPLGGTASAVVSGRPDLPSTSSGDRAGSEPHSPGHRHHHDHATAAPTGGPTDDLPLTTRRPNAPADEATGLTERWTGTIPPRSLTLAAGGTAELVGPYLGSDRLWIARFELDRPVLQFLAAHGRPIRYGYVPRPWPLSAYQNVFANEPGSAEMPSAARPFTPEVLMRLVAKGVAVTPLVLHTGVASLEADELPYPERFRVPQPTADRVNDTHRAGGRVVAIGTTVVRALESATDESGHLEARDGWTDLVITPERGVFTVDGLLTGWHEPEASHLLMLEAVAGRELIERSYEAGLANGYRWHEFGDTHLLLP